MRSRFLALLLAGVLAGCTNLTAVRQFAGESAQLAAYTDLTQHFRDTYAREQPYLYGDQEALAKANDARRQAAFDDLIKIHDNVALYMATLAQLAGEDTFDLSKGLQGVTDGIKEHPELGVEASHVDAYATIVKTIAKWITSARQESAVKGMVKDGAKPLATTLEGMSNILRYYQKTHENEKRTVTGFLDALVRVERQDDERLLASLGRAHLQEKRASYAQTDARIKAAQAGVKAVADGHALLLDNLNKLSLPETKARLKAFTRDIKTVRAALQGLQP